MDKSRMYTLGEVSSATGLTINAIQYRKKMLGFVEPGKIHQGMTYDQIKQIIGYHRERKHKSLNQFKVNKLKMTLMNDGFKIKED